MRNASLALALSAALFSSSAHAVQVPVDIGVGPAAYYFFGPVASERNPIPHFGLKLNVLAVIDAEFIAAHPNLIPPRYKRMARGVSEVRVSPSLFIPDALILSPKVDPLGRVGMYGVTWRPFSLGVPLLDHRSKNSPVRSPVKLDLDAGLLITYAFIYGDEFPTTHFLRPGLDLMLELELELTRDFLISLGWASQLYVPQAVGSFGFGPLDQSIFHVGQAFLKLHFRMPYETKL